MVFNWHLSPDDQHEVRRIVDRALHALGLTPHEAIQLEMDITVVHNHITPLRLRELADTSAFNFAHDVTGIRRHLNRQTGELERFVPRFAQSTKQ